MTTSRKDKGDHSYNLRIDEATYGLLTEFQIKESARLNRICSKHEITISAIKKAAK